MGILENRRSIRKFTDRPVEEEKIEELLRAAMQAPSAGNQQPWEFIVVTDETLQDELSTLSPYSLPIKNAPISIVVASTTKSLRFKDYAPQDLSAATQNILLKATELDLGAVWQGVYPLQDRMDIIAKILNLPENLEAFSVISLGYSEDKNIFIDRFDKDRIHYNKF